MVIKIDCSSKKNSKKEKCKKQVGEAVFSILVPKADNSRNKINHKEYNKVRKEIHKRFGGSTTKPTTLGCYTDKGKIYCETGFQIQAYRDFDTPYQKNNELKSLDAQQRQKKLKEDYAFMKRQASILAKSFGQDSVPVIYDNVSDISYLKGQWRNKMRKSRVGKKVTDKPFRKYI